MTAPPPSHKEYPVGWEEFQRDAKALAWRLLEKGPWKGIIAITRGGLVPAAIVARELDVRIIETVGIASYHGEDGGVGKRGVAEILKAPSKDIGNGNGWLVVDDLADTGQTIEILRKTLPKAHYAAVFAKPLGRSQIDTYVTEVSQDTWIFFPWESTGT
jgi:hypoxanthine phosphoribosyltransferase